jgi:hypothetical protein
MAYLGRFRASTNVPMTSRHEWRRYGSVAIQGELLLASCQILNHGNLADDLVLDAVEDFV